MNGKIHGKQIRDTSVDLLKLDLTGSQGTFFFGTGSYLGAYEVPNIPQAFITKQYADSLSSGLDPKESVYLVSVVNIPSLSGTQSIDGVTASVGSRVLLTSQASPVDNGIYVVGVTAWSRATDSDGDLGHEVSLGNYTFVERGVTFSSTGWVLYDTNAPGSTVSVGVDTQLWTQFNGAGSFIWGDGLTNTGNNIFIDLDPNSGLTFSSTKLKIADYAAGGGLTITNGVLSAGAGAGITINADTIDINYVEASEGLEGSGLTAAGGKINVGAGSGITVNTDNVAVDYVTVATQLAGNGLNNNGTTIDVNVSNGLTIIGDSVQVDQSIAGSGLTFAAGVLNITGSTAIGVNSDSIYVKYDPNTISIDGNGALTVISAGDAILDIVAGRGISGNQLSGPTASIDVELTDNGGLTFSGTGTGSTVQVDYAPVATQLSGAGLINNGTTIDVNTGAGITISSDAVAINYTAVATQLAGNGLLPNGTTIDINVAKGVTISGDALFADADTIVTTANLPTVAIATGSTIQSALTAIDNKLTNVGAQQMICTASTVTGTFLKAVSIPQDVLGVTYSTASDGCPSIFINGAYVRPSSATVSTVAYFSTNGGNTGTETVEIGSRLYVNVNQLGYNLDNSDVITVHYLTRVS